MICLQETETPTEGYLIMTTKYCVEFWGSHPDDDNDDCWTGDDFSTEAAARKQYDNPVFPLDSPSGGVAYIQLTRVDGNLVEQLAVRPNPGFLPNRPHARDDWRQEAAVQAGMMGGCEAYNEVMGY